MNTYESIMDALGKTAELTRANSENTAIVLAKLNEQETLINGLSNTVSGISETMTGLSDDINQLKLNEEVTTTQQEIIVESAQKRVIEIIGDDPLEREKYFKIFNLNLNIFFSKYSLNYYPIFQNIKILYKRNEIKLFNYHTILSFKI